MRRDETRRQKSFLFLFLFCSNTLFTPGPSSCRTLIPFCERRVSSVDESVTRNSSWRRLSTKAYEQSSHCFEGLIRTIEREEEEEEGNERKKKKVPVDCFTRHLSAMFIHGKFFTQNAFHQIFGSLSIINEISFWWRTEIDHLSRLTCSLKTRRCSVESGHATPNISSRRFQFCRSPLDDQFSLPSSFQSKENIVDRAKVQTKWMLREHSSSEWTWRGGRCRMIAKVM